MARSDVEKIKVLIETLAPAKSSSSSGTTLTMASVARRKLSRLMIEQTKYGTVRSMYSPRASIPVEDMATSATPEVAARAFLAAYPGLFGLDPKIDTLVLETVKSNKKGGHMVKLKQRHDNVSCRGAAVTVILDAQRRVRGYAAPLMPVVSPATAKLSAAQAASAALKAGDTQAGGAYLEYVDRPGWRSARLAWNVPLVDHAGEGYDVRVDPQSGKELFREPRSHAAIPWNRELWDSVASPYKIRGEEPYYCQAGGMNADETATWDASEEVATYLGVRGHMSWDGAGGNMRTHYSMLTGKGTWNHPIYPEQVIVRPPCAQANELVAHEWGHGVAHDRDIPNSPLEEGLADCFAMMVYPNNWVWNDTAPAGCTGTRSATWALNGGFRNKNGGLSYHHDGQIVSHLCYLTSFDSSYPAHGPYPCNASTPCPGAPSPVVECLNNTCVTWSNAVSVPYHGHDRGYEPIFNLVTGYYPWLGPHSDLVSIVSEMIVAGCVYDEDELGVPPCSVMGETNYLAAMAAGLWMPPSIVFYMDNDNDFSINTDRRPAFIENAKTGTTTNWLAMFYREGRNTGDKEVIHYTFSGSEYADPLQVPLKVLDSASNPVKAGSGITVVESPKLSSPTPDLALFFRSPTSNYLHYTVGTKGSSSISFGAVQTVNDINTATRPTAINFHNALWYLWKDAVSNDIKVMIHGTPPAVTLSANGITPQTDFAPAAVVAENRLWVFFHSKDENNYIYYMSHDGDVWSTPVRVEENHTNAAPEAIYYRPQGGAKGDGRIWLFYRRPVDQTPEGTYQVSFIPMANGGITDKSKAVYLEQTQVPVDPYFPYFSATTWGPMLRLYNPSKRTGIQVNNVWPMDVMEKLGEG